jgi:hypothetical protein
MALNGRYIQVLHILSDAGLHGATAREVATSAGVNRSTASGALSNLMNRGDVIKLPMTRDGSVIYMHAALMENARDALGLTEKAEDAFDRGFALGLSEGAAGSREEAMAAGYEDGWREGQAAFAKQLDRFLEEMTRAMRRAKGMSVVARTGDTWMTHPPHTIDVVRKHLERTSGVAQTSPQVEPLRSGVVDLTVAREAGS